MGDWLFNAALWTGGLVCAATLLFMLFILLAFIAGEIRRMNQARHRRLVKETHLKKTRREMENRELRLQQEKELVEYWERQLFPPNHKN